MTYPTKRDFRRNLVTLAIRRGVRKEYLNKRWQYNFDGIDDYIQLPTIPLFAGDVVEFDFVINIHRNYNTILDNYLLDSEGNEIYGNAIGIVNFRLGFGQVASKVLSENTLYQAKILINADTHSVYLNDVLIGTSTVSTSTRAIASVGGGHPANATMDGLIKNLRITRANPTEQYPDLFYPIDDGAGATIIRQTIPHAHKIDGTPVNFNDERWESV